MRVSRLISRSLGVVGLTAVIAMLGACAEKRDTASASRKLDDSPIQGANGGYAAAGWKAGDATSWEEHMRTRTQGQNEYARTGAASR